MMVDNYITIKEPSEGEYKEKGSKFLAYAFPLDEESQLQSILAELHQIHPKARHFCFAYKIGLDDTRYRMNDDGEPSGTAGKPIYGQILSFGITNVIIVVVRYFGGTKLGVPGLIHAYKEATKNSLEMASIIEKFIYTKFSIILDFDKMGQTMNILNKYPIQFLAQSFEDRCTIDIQMRKSIAEEWQKSFMGDILGRSAKDIIGTEDLGGIEITQIE
ncbi:MAG: YigZ family protein [Saprospiraceae bacterium]